MSLRVTGVARLTRDPELKYTASEKAICALGLAVDQGYGDRKSTCFIDATAFGKTAEIAASNLAKGRQIYLEDAHLELQTWEKDGVWHRKHCVILNRFEFVGPKPEASSDSPPARPASSASRQDDADDESIPF